MAAGGTNRNFKLVTPNYLVQCHEGDDVKLSCQLSPETSAAGMEIRWFMGTVCIYLSKDGHVMERSGYEGKVSVDSDKMQSGDVSLKLRRSIEGNIGVYTCQIISGEYKKEGRVGLVVKRASLQPALSYIIDELDERLEEITAEERRKMEESVQSLTLALQSKTREQLKETVSVPQRTNTKQLEKTRQLEKSNKVIKVSELEKRDGQQEESSKDHEDRTRKQEKNCSELTNRGDHQTGQHFIDRHGITLIDNVRMVDPVLDRLLYWKVLTREACDDVRSHRTRQNQMRCLLNQGSIHGTQKGKDLLYKALKETEPFLMQQLEQ